MGVGERKAAWAEVADAVASDGDKTPLGRDREGSAVSLRPPSEWTGLFGFTVMMIIPFALVAWLMS